MLNIANEQESSDSCFFTLRKVITASIVGYDGAMQMLAVFDQTLFTLLHDTFGIVTVWDVAIIFFAEYAQYVIGAYFFYLVVMTGRDRKDQLLLLTSTFVSLILSRLVVVEAIRIFWNRPRPFMVLQFIPPFPELSASFPSGHATFFFALAMMVWLHRRPHAGIFALAAMCISVARVVAGVHYPSDIIAGAMIGAIMAYYSWRFIDPMLRRRIMVEVDAAGML